MEAAEHATGLGEFPHRRSSQEGSFVGESHKSEVACRPARYTTEDVMKKVRLGIEKDNGFIEGHRDIGREYAI